MKVIKYPTAEAVDAALQEREPLLLLCSFDYLVFYWDGTEVFSKALKQLGLPAEIEIPKRYWSYGCS